MTEKRPYGPVIEKPAKDTSFITEDPLKILTSGNYNKVPILIGYCKDEGIFTEAILTRVGKESIHTDFEDVINYRMGIIKGSDVSKRVARKIQEFYYPKGRSKFDPVQAFYDVGFLFFQVFFMKLQAIFFILAGIRYKICEGNLQHRQKFSGNRLFPGILL